MPRALTRGDSRPSKRTIKGPTSSKPKKAKKGRTSRAKKARVVKPRTPAAFHDQAQTPAGAEHPSDAGLPFGGAGSSAGVSPRALVELTGISSASEAGLGGAILDLVGEGRLSVSHALSAWTHEQDRLANRAWRRPGGLQRMGGL